MRKILPIFIFSISFQNVYCQHIDELIIEHIERMSENNEDEDDTFFGGL